MPNVLPDVLESFTAALFRGAGSSEEEAATVARDRCG